MCPTGEPDDCYFTVGILLEELRAKGVEALTRYKCVLIDECLRAVNGK
jgi:hypothetical protein